MSRMGHLQVAIPEDVQPGPGWTGQMLEMADHIGAYRTLLIVEKYGGQTIYIAADPARNCLRDLIGTAAAETMSHVYRRERLQIPTGKFALNRARRAALVAAARADEVAVAEAARMIGTSRSYFSHLVNQTSEGTDDEQIPARGAAHPGQMDLFGEDD